MQMAEVARTDTSTNAKWKPVIECWQCGFSSHSINKIKDHFRTHIHCGPNRPCQQETEKAESSSDDDKDNNKKLPTTNPQKEPILVDLGSSSETCDNENSKPLPKKKKKKRFKCSTCGMTFSSSNLFEKHEKAVHSMDISSPNVLRNDSSKKDLNKPGKSAKRRSVKLNLDEDPLVCMQCGKLFTSIHSLIKHELQHEENRPHVCTVCQSAFKQSWHLKKHMLTHAENLVHSCSFCQKGFSQKSLYNAHILSCKERTKSRVDAQKKAHKMTEQAGIEREKPTGTVKPLYATGRVEPDIFIPVFKKEKN